MLMINGCETGAYLLGSFSYINYSLLNGSINRLTCIEFLSGTISECFVALSGTSQILLSQ